MVDSNMCFFLISSRDADPPEFALSFNSSLGPPTMVECTVNGDSFNYTVSREVKVPQFVLNGDFDSVNDSMPDTLDVTEVMVRVRGRQGGVYQCNVTVMGRMDSSPGQVVILGNGTSTANISGMCV